MQTATSASSMPLTPFWADVRSRLRIRATTSDFVVNTRDIDVTRRLALAMRRRVDVVGSEDLRGNIRPIKFSFDKPDQIKRRRRRRCKESVNRGSEKRILDCLGKATSSIEGNFFSSTGEREITGFSRPGAGVVTAILLRCEVAIAKVTSRASEQGKIFSTAATSLSISSRNGKKASTTESRMP
jgi:hypothetical protein